MIKYLTLIITLLSFHPLLKSQSIKPAFSYTYLFEPLNQGKLQGYHESTFNFNIAYALNSRHSIGLQYLDIRTSGSASRISGENKNYFLAGLFYQYDLLKNSPSALFPEVSINYGSYCTCGRLDPFEKAGITYLGYGFGYDFPLYKSLYLDLGFHIYRPIANVQDEEYFYSYTQYVVGFSYKILGE